MSNLLAFHTKYIELITAFEQEVAKEAAKITLEEILKNIDPSIEKNPIRPRIDVSSELEGFNDGDMIQFGVLYQSRHSYSQAFTLNLTRQKAELYEGNSKDKPLRTFSGSKVTSFYNTWARRLEQAKSQLQEPPF